MKYYQVMSTNFRNMRAGRISKAEGIKNIAIVMVIIPMLFQLMSDGFKWRWEKQLRAWILGPLNYMVIFGEVAKSLYDKVTGENWGFQLSPALELFDDVYDLIGDLQRLAINMKDPSVDISGDDVIKMIERAAKVIGPAFALPTPFLIQVERAIRTGEPMEIIFSNWSLRPLELSDNQKATQLTGNLGQSSIDIGLASEDYETRKKAEDELRQRTQDIEAGLTVPELDIYNMNDMDNSFKNIFKRVLPQSILEDKNSSDIAKSWAEQEYLWNTEVWLLPDKPLYELFENEADLDTRYKDWLAFNAIDFKSIAEMEEWVSNRMDDNLHYGNITRSEYELLKQYYLLDDEARKKFLEKHPSLTVDKRDKYLRDNPKANALLALWGEAKLLTQSAYNAMLGMMDSLNIPFEALDGMQIPPRELSGDYFGYQDILLESTSSSNEAHFYRLLHPKFDQWALGVGIYEAQAREEVKEIYPTDKLKQLLEEYNNLRLPLEPGEEIGKADSKARDQFRYDNKLLDAYKVYAEGGTPVLDSGWETVKLSEILEWYKLGKAKDKTVTSDKEPRDINVIWIPIPSHTNLPDNIQPLWDEYDSLRKPPTEEYPDGQADSKARAAYRRAHPELDAYGIEQGWWKESSSGGGGVPGPVFDTSEFLK